MTGQKCSGSDTHSQYETVDSSTALRISLSVHPRCKLATTSRSLTPSIHCLDGNCGVLGRRSFRDDHIGLVIQATIGESSVLHGKSARRSPLFWPPWAPVFFPSLEHRCCSLLKAAFMAIVELRTTGSRAILFVIGTVSDRNAVCGTNLLALLPHVGVSYIHAGALPLAVIHISELCRS